MVVAVTQGFALSQTPHESSTPLLVFDGDCGFCVYAVGYAKAVAGDRVDFGPYQAVAGQRTEFTETQYQDSIRLLRADGNHCHGALAAFTVLALGGMGFWLWCYRRLPGFGPAAEVAYRWVAGHRPFCLAASRLAFGAKLRPLRVAGISGWLTAGVGLIYVFAFVSLGLQVQGLIGQDGITPAAPYLDAIQHQLGITAWWRVPGVFWLDASDPTLVTACWLGVAAGLAMVAGVRPAAAAAVAWLLYLSLVGAGQVFLQFQWDMLLLEAGFLAIFLRASPRLVIWLYRLLLLRFMLQSGLVKLFSGDPAWWDFTALSYHFETQPLPTVLAWYAHHLPGGLLQAGVVFTFLVELLVPLLLLMPRRLRVTGGVFVLVLEALILLTGSYNFFNLLTIVLCLALLDDTHLRALPWFRQPQRSWLTRAVVPVALLHVLMGTSLILATGNFSRLPEPLQATLRTLAPLRLVNSYGPFAVMTRERREVSFEGSDDGQRWQPYRLYYNPSEPSLAPRIAAPMQPRLDWQLWFAALGTPRNNVWIHGIAAGLLTGSGPVLSFFRENPFADSPPRYVRAVIHPYRFTSPAERAATGNWWVVGKPRLYLQPQRLSEPP